MLPTGLTASPTSGSSVAEAAAGAPEAADEEDRSGATSADGTAATAFDRDTAVQVRSRSGDSGRAEVELAAVVSPDWRAGRGPHGGYLAAMLTRALIEAVDDAERAPRSLTIHYARAPDPGPVGISVRVERAGRSLSTLSARMQQDGTLVALALAAFSVPWSAPEIDELPMPEVATYGPERKPVPPFPGAPPFTRRIVLQPRLGAVPFGGSDAPMEVGAWLGLAEPRRLDAISLAFFTDALFSPPFIRLTEPSTTPTIDLTVHFRTPIARAADADPNELCFARFRSGLVTDGFFEEDGVIWRRDGAVLAQSRQLGIVMPRPTD
jgi:acyl-CoA thioesterase